jgi:hypothetical protein
MTAAIINADAALFIANVVEGTTPISLNEPALTEILDESPLVRGYTFLGWTANEVLSDNSKGYKELSIHFGLRNLDHYNVNMHSLPANYLKNSLTQYYYSDDAPEDVLQVLHEMSNSSSY